MLNVNFKMVVHQPPPPASYNFEVSLFTDFYLRGVISCHVACSFERLMMYMGSQPISSPVQFEAGLTCITLLENIFVKTLRIIRRISSNNSQHVSTEMPIQSPNCPPMSATRFTLCQTENNNT